MAKTKIKSDSDSNNLIVIGNGFDLACGEKTSIFDFVNFETQKLKYSQNPCKINFIIWLIARLSSADNGHAWREFLKLNDSEINDWMDFEKVINVLVLDEEVFNKLDDIYRNYYMQKQTGTTVSSVLASFFQNCHDWGNDLVSTCNSYVEFLEKTIGEFEILLRDYLTKIDNDLPTYAKKELLLNYLNSGYKRTTVMDFNYTNIPNDPFFHPVFYIHGNVSTNCIIGIDPYYKNPGINDLYKTLGQKIRFTKIYKRLNYSSKLELQQIVLKKGINKITFFGHSFGEQDYSYFQSTFDFIDLYNSNVVLAFCYIEFEENAVIKEKDRVTKRVFNLINRYGETLTNKDHGNNLLNKLLLEGRIVFCEVFPEEVFIDDKINALLKKYEIG